MTTWEGTPDRGPGIEEILQRISGQLGKIDAKLEKIEDEEIPAKADRGLVLNIIRYAAAFAVAVALALGALAFWSHRQDVVSIENNQDQAQYAASAAVAGCLASNRFRAREEKWDEELIAALPRTSAYKAEAARLLADAKAKNKPRDCSHPAAAT